jgi:secondary thiamine-phosphate synthase enzyme
MVKTFSLQLQTRGDADTINVTGAVAQSVTESGLTAGIATVFTPSATSALTTIEYESGCVQDFQRLFDEIANAEREYAHNQRWEDGNGHSHIRAALLGPSLTVPFQGQKLLLGTWQQIILIDFDNRPRQRELIVQIIGE